MLLLTSLCVLLCACVSDAFLFGGGSEKWDALKVHFSLNPFKSVAFKSMPRTETAAIDEGFTKDASCSDSKPYLGNRYVKNNDHAVMLLYDRNGYIAGIQVGIPKNLPRSYPSSYIRGPWIDGGDEYLLTAYFVDPSTICTSGRTSAQFDLEGTGTHLYIQNNANPLRNLIDIPFEESDIGDTMWTRGKCFVSMGQHYWYNLRPDMNCDEFFPVFLLYNSGKLNGFGWALGADLPSDYFEHPPRSTLRLFMDPPPNCLLNSLDRRSSIHIYLGDSPRLHNWC